ncbi:MAG: hypothetical protein ACSHX4_08110 [Opitutaceae bacterium]
MSINLSYVSFTARFPLHASGYAGRSRLRTRSAQRSIKIEVFELRQVCLDPGKTLRAMLCHCRSQGAFETTQPQVIRAETTERFPPKP